MDVHVIPCGPVEANTYIIKGSAGCIAIDPADASLVKAYCEENGLTITDVLLTHGHFDHIMGVAELQSRGAKVYIYKDDAEALHSNHKNLALMGGIAVSPCHADIELSDGDTIEAAGYTIKVIHTPGHTPGGACFVFERERAIFTGDTLFRLSVGRCDLPGGDSRQLFDSIQYGLFTLKGDYTVYPGHMRETTLEFERQHNPFMKNLDAEIW